MADFIRLVAKWSGNENSLTAFEERAGGCGLEKGHESALILGCGELPSLPPPTMVKTFLPPPHPPPLHSKSSLLAKAEEITVLIPRFNCAVLHKLHSVLMTSGQVGNFALNGTANAVKDYLAPKSPS